MNIINTREMISPYKLSVTYKGVLLYERIFDSECFNQITRNNLNLKSLYHKYRDDLKTTLARKTNELSFNLMGYSLKPSKTWIKGRFDYLNKYYLNKKTNSKEENTVKMVLYNNNNIVIERETVVKDLNVESFNSLEFLFLNDELVSNIEQLLKTNDINQIFSEKEIMSKYSLGINEIRNLSEQEKTQLLK